MDVRDDVTTLDFRGDDISVLSSTTPGEVLVIALPVEDRVFAGPPFGTPDTGDLFVFRDTDGTAQTELIEFDTLAGLIGSGGGSGTASVVALEPR